jgi:hypothetical protein
MLLYNILSDKYLTSYILLKQGAMVQIIVPKKLEHIFKPLLNKVQGTVCVLTNLTAVDVKQRTHTYHHQNYMLQFEQI